MFFIWQEDQWQKQAAIKILSCRYLKKCILGVLNFRLNHLFSLQKT